MNICCIPCVDFISSSKHKNTAMKMKNPILLIYNSIWFILGYPRPYRIKRKNGGNLKEIAQRVKKLRKTAKLGQDYMARLLGIKRAAYSKIERGINNINEKFPKCNRTLFFLKFLRYFLTIS